MNYEKYYTETVYNGKWKRYTYNAIDAYREVDKPNDWLECPYCEKIPLIWIFDNGRCTACGCGENKYNKFSVHAESVMSVIYRNDGSTIDYDSDELRKNWNHWCKTGELKFIKGNGRW